MEVLQEAKTQQMYNAVCSQTAYKNNPDLQSTLGSGTLSHQHFKVDLTNWKDRYSILPPQTLCINRVMVHKMDIELQSLRFEQGSGRTGIDSSFLDFMHQQSYDHMTKGSQNASLSCRA
jgi:hypothetical protein